MPFKMHQASRFAALLGCCLLAACGGDDKAGTANAAGEDGLPRPAAASGSVTGMPNPGVADARPAPRNEPRLDIVELPEPLEPGEIPAPDPAMPPQPIIDPVTLPAPPMPEDPAAPPPPPAQSGLPEDNTQ